MKRHFNKNNGTANIEAAKKKPYRNEIKLSDKALTQAESQVQSKAQFMSIDQADLLSRWSIFH
ncbi:hypothetical protein PanWU01x14_037860 [Parasponia andersonii]|uniref:Uncharacterized protein n=1 Tax=Parasponia andersonii TaxID=3476 RepID=A0A2P5DS07_PARAD|nr:hypothetical protein PanWU01x14_037860 [Parasponia andersonii]